MSTAPYKTHINSSKDLVTTRAEIRAGFLAAALEKNRQSTPFIDRAKNLKAVASKSKTADGLLKMKEIRGPLLTASGLSDKALTHLDEKDKEKAISELIKNFLKPAGKDFVDELVFRYLLIQGDSLGGSMRNIVGALATQKLTRAIISALTNAEVTFRWIDRRSKKSEWIDGDPDDPDLETNLKAISWSKDGVNRLLVYNTTVPIVGKNIDVVLFDATSEEDIGALLDVPEKFIMLGELKGGIDPAGADEHWKTANSALGRIRSAFSKVGVAPKTMFIAAAIEVSMANEIWAQLESGDITNAANLTDDAQIAHLCNWIIKL